MRALAVLASLWLAAPGGAAAQDAGATFQDSTGLSWSVATLEVGLAATALGAGLAGEEDAGTVSLLLSSLTLLASGVLGGVTQALDAPVEPPMLTHQTLIGGALLGGLVSFSLRVAGERDGDLVNGLGVAGLLAGGAAQATYTLLRMDRLAHDPRLLVQAHLMSWGPTLAAGILSALLGSAGLDDEAGLVGAVAGLLLLGATVVATEVAIAEGPAPVTAPLASRF